MRTTLYKLDFSHRLREWTCWIENHETRSYVFIRHGLSGGQQPIERIAFPNAIASSPLARNPSTHIEASIEEYNRRIAKQKDRRGYTTTIPTVKPFRPMLLHHYQENAGHVPPICFIQPKLNGLRCISSNRWMMSRTGTNFYSLPHIQTALSSLPDDIVLDGELYFHGWSLQKIMSCCHRDRPTPDSFYIEYHLYDIVDENLAYTDRLALLKELLHDLNLNYADLLTNLSHEDCPPELTSSLFHQTTPPRSHYVLNPLKLSDTLSIPSREVQEHYDHYLSQGYEGAIIRSPYSPYEINTRSLGVLKYKPRQKATCKILDVTQAKRNHHQGILHLYSPKHTKFSCSSRGNDSYRSYLLSHKEEFIGQLCEVEFEDYSADNIPIQPVCTHIYKKAKP